MSKNTIGVSVFNIEHNFFRNSLSLLHSNLLINAYMYVFAKWPYFEARTALWADHLSAKSSGYNAI